MILRILLGVLLLILAYGCQNIPHKIIITNPLPSNEILFVRNLPLPSFKDFKGELWTIDRDGKNQMKVLEAPTAIGDASWSPHGEKIAIEYSYEKDMCEIWIIEIGKEEIIPKRIFKTKLKNFQGGISWAPDNKKIAFGMNNSIYIIDSNGENLRKITEGASPSWSPDGKRIVFRGVIEGKWKVYVVDIDGTNRERLTNSPSSIEEIRPVWSPDGKWIVFQEEKVNEQNKIVSINIVLINLETKSRQELISFPRLEFRHLCCH